MADNPDPDRIPGSDPAPVSPDRPDAVVAALIRHARSGVGVGELHDGFTRLCAHLFDASQPDMAAAAFAAGDAEPIPLRPARPIADVTEALLDLSDRLPPRERDPACLKRRPMASDRLTRMKASLCPRAMVLNPDGFSVRGEAAIARLIEEAGMENAAETIGIDHYGHLPVETVFAADLDVLIVDVEEHGSPGLAQFALADPRGASRARPVVAVYLPPRLWAYPGPADGEAMAFIGEAWRLARRSAALHADAA